MEDDKIAWGVFKTSGVLLFVWYLLLLYVFPYRIPYFFISRDKWFAVTLYAFSSFAVFFVIAGGLAVFSLKIIRLLGQQNYAHSEGNPGEQTFFQSVEAHFLTHVRLLFLLSTMIFALKIASDLRREEELIILIFLAVPFFIVLDIFTKRFVAKTKTLTSRQWTPTGWVASCVLLFSSVALLQTLVSWIMEIARYKRENDWTETIVFMLVNWSEMWNIIIIGLIAGYSGAATFKRRHTMVEDAKTIFRWISARSIRSTPITKD